MSASDQTAQRVNLVYEGPYLGTMLWVLITFVVSVFIIPAAWATAFLYRRILPQISFGDGTRAAFQGRAGKIWGWFVLPTVVYVICIVAGGIVYNREPFSLILLSDEIESALSAGDNALAFALVNVGLAAGISALVVTIVVAIYVYRVIIRWSIAGIELTNGPDFRFTGRYLPLAGWLLVLVLSIITIIGWAWVATGFLRWFAGNVEGDGVGFDFVGRAWGLLWRAMAFLVVFIALTYSYVVSASPVPLILELIWALWVGVWLLKWVMRSVVLFRLAPSPGTAATEM